MIHPADSMPEWEPEQYEEARERAKNRLYQYDIDTLLDGLTDDLPHAFGTDWPAMIEACRARDRAEIGLLTERALDRIAEQYLDTTVGQLLIEDAASEI